MGLLAQDSAEGLLCFHCAKLIKEARTPPDDQQNAAKFSSGDIVFVSGFDGHEDKIKNI